MEQSIANFAGNTVPADVLALLDAGTSAGTAMMYGPNIHTEEYRRVNPSISYNVYLYINNMNYCWLRWQSLPVQHKAIM